MAVDALEARLDAMLARFRADDADPDLVSFGPPIVERCLFCDFTVSAPVGEARVAFAAHECSRPRPAPRKRNRGFTIRR